MHSALLVASLVVVAGVPSNQALVPSGVQAAAVSSSVPLTLPTQASGAQATAAKASAQKGEQRTPAPAAHTKDEHVNVNALSLNHTVTAKNSIQCTCNGVEYSANC